MLFSYDISLGEKNCSPVRGIRLWYFTGTNKIHLKLYFLALTVFEISKFYRHGVKFISYKLNNKPISICLEPLFTVYTECRVRQISTEECQNTWVH